MQFKPTLAPGRLLGVAALLATGNLFAAPCEVATDPAMDATPAHDIISVSLDGSATSMSAQLEVSGLMLPPTVNTDYRVHWVDGSGNGYYLAAWFIADSLEVGYEYGTYDGSGPGIGPGLTAYTFVDGASGSVDGNVVTITAPAAAVGRPAGTLSGVGAVVDIYGAVGNVNIDVTDNSGEYTVGGCSSRSALLAADTPPKVENACLVADESGAIEAVPPTHDIQTLSMYTAGGELGMEMELSTPAGSNPSTTYRVSWPDTSGSGFISRFMEVAVNQVTEAGPATTFTYGHSEDLAGNENLITDGAATGTVSGNVVTVQAPIAVLGNPGRIEVSGAASMLVGIPGAGLFLSADTTTPAVYTVGDSCASKADYIGVHFAANQALRAAELAANAAANSGNGAGGALGWLMILGGLLGLRRRTR